MTALPETKNVIALPPLPPPEPLLDSLERRVRRGYELHAASVKGEPAGHISRSLPWSVMVECPTLDALCVLARAAIEDLEDLSPEEAAAVAMLERES